MPKGETYLLRIFSISNTDIDELCMELKAMLLKIIKAQQDNSELP
jgi:hypothetical protein